MLRRATEDVTLLRLVAPYVSPTPAFVEIGLWPARRTLEGQLRVDERGVWIAGEMLVSREQVKEAYLVDAHRRHPAVRLRRHGLRSSMDIEVSTLEEGRAVLQALGHDGAQAALTVSMTWPRLGEPRLEKGINVAFGLMTLTILPLGAAAVNLVGRDLLLLLLFAWLSLFVLAIGILILPGKITIGADGLLFSWLGRTRFIPYHDIYAVNTLYPRPGPDVPPVGVQLYLTDGRVLQLRMSDGAGMYERIAEAVNAWWGRDDALRTALVQRGPHDARAWLRALRSIGARASVGYRNATLADDLWRVVEDSAAPPDARAGAAAALGASLGAEGRGRLRDAARKTVQPKLRIAIEAAASAVEDKALVEALSEVESAKPLRQMGQR